MAGDGALGPAGLEGDREGEGEHSTGQSARVNGQSPKRSICTAPPAAIIRLPGLGGRLNHLTVDSEELNEAFEFGESSAPVARAATDRPVSVSELTQALKRFIERTFADVYVEGEISNWRPASSGHVYFSLKDSRATVNCVLWAHDVAKLDRPLRDGEKVEVRGRISLYEPRGSYQILVQTIRPAGLGKLFLRFQELKERLEREGLFDPVRKRPIPRFPKRVGVVTSTTGAAIRDILQVMQRRAPHLSVLIWNATVQGEGAAQTIAYGIGRMNALRLVDVLIVGRGGGSIEDLWPFNEEVVARAIAASAIPVISAVGHEIDFTISDFVADLRAPTPSAAAELVAQSSTEVLRNVGHMNSRLTAAIARRIEFLYQVRHLQVRLEKSLMPRIDLMRSHVRRFEERRALQIPLQKVNEMRQQLDDLGLRMQRGIERHCRDAQSRQSWLQTHLNALNPTSILARGYSITFDRKSGKVLRSELEAGPGQQLRIRLHEGHVDATVDGGRSAGRAPRTRKGAKSSDEQLELFGDEGAEVARPAGKLSETAGQSEA